MNMQVNKREQLGKTYYEYLIAVTYKEKLYTEIHFDRIIQLLDINQHALFFNTA